MTISLSESKHLSDGSSHVVFVENGELADNRILNWGDQDPILRDLWTRNVAPELIANELGRSVAAIMTRAARLGLPRRASPGRKRIARSPEEQKQRQVQSRAASRSLNRDMFREALQPKEGAALRVCLMCVSTFQSAGRHNRICPKCKGSAEYEAGARLPDIDF